MAFFKFRKAGDDVAAAPVPAESVEVMRRRARHRLLGAALLVLIGVVGFPLLFETQPRSTGTDIPIDIPDKGKVKPLPMPAAPVEALPASAAAPPAPPPLVTASTASPAKTASAGLAAPARVAPASSLDPHEEVVPPKAPAGSEAKVPSKPEVKVAPPSAKPALPASPASDSGTATARATVPPPKVDDGAKARALLDGKEPASPAPAASGDARFVVQVGAFADAGKARDVRQKLEKAGLKTYTQVVDTKDGKRTRVRVGPFATRDEADKAVNRVKGLDLHAVVLTL